MGLNSSGGTSPNTFFGTCDFKVGPVKKPPCRTKMGQTFTNRSGQAVSVKDVYFL